MALAGARRCTAARPLGVLCFFATAPLPFPVPDVTCPPSESRSRPLTRLGKLSLFSVARTIEVHTAKKGGKSKAGFKMDLDKIRQRISGAGMSGAECPLEPVPESKIGIRQGTMIRLTNLKRHIGQDPKSVRRRIARRFSIISPAHGFSVKINGTRIAAADRDYFTSLEYVWYMGRGGRRATARCRCERIELGSEVNRGKEYSVSGWIGTAKEQRQIDDENNKITVLARGKIIHEDILGDIKVGGLYSKYLIGEIQADFLDYDELDDISTTNRQRVMDYDERYLMLKEYVRTCILQKIQQKWTELRARDAEDKVRRDPAIARWFNGLGRDNKRSALSLFRKIEEQRGMDKDARIELYKTSIVAFSTLAVNDRLADLDRLETDDNLEALLAIIGDMDELEAVHYYDITRGRLNVLEKFEGLVDDNAREKVLQKYLFKHLWLLDHSWERTGTDERMEKSFRDECKRNGKAALTEEEQRSRIDIRYLTSAGKHIVVELKRSGLSVDAYELARQAGKYNRILTKLLRRQNPDEEPQIEIICVLGSAPATDDDIEGNRNLLKAKNARYVTYESLISQAKKAYGKYLRQKREIRNIRDMIDKITLPDEPPPGRAAKAAARGAAKR